MKVCRHQTLKKRVTIWMMNIALVVALSLSNLGGVFSDSIVLAIDSSTWTELKPSDPFPTSNKYKLVNDYTLFLPPDNIIINGDLMLDLNGRKLTLGDHTINITSSGHLHLYGNGEVVRVGSSSIDVHGCFDMNNGKVGGISVNVREGGKFYMNDGELNNVHIYIYGNALFNLNGGIFNASATTNPYDGAKIQINGGLLNGGQFNTIQHNSELVMTGGTISGDFNFNIIQNQAKIIITGGTINEANQNKLLSQNCTKITFAPGEGTGTMTPYFLKNINKYNLPACKFTKNGYHFAGWRDENGDVHPAGYEVTPATLSDATYTAVWEVNPPSSSSSGTSTTTRGESYSYDDDDDYTPVSRYQVSSGGATGGGTSNGGVMNSNGEAVFTFTTSSGTDDSFDHFTGAQMDGVNMERGRDYEASRGSTIITVKKALLDTLDDSTHYLTAFFDDGSVTASFSKKDLPVKIAPKTGEV